MRITRNDVADPRKPASPPALGAVRAASSTAWMGMALVGTALTVGTDVPSLVALGAVVTGVGAYLLGKADRNIPVDPRVASLTAQNGRMVAYIEQLRRDGPPPGPDRRDDAPAPAEPRPLAVVPDSRRRGGVDAAAAVDALDAPLPGEAGATEA